MSISWHEIERSSVSLVLVSEDQSSRIQIVKSADKRHHRCPWNYRRQGLRGGRAQLPLNPHSSATALTVRSFRGRRTTVADFKEFLSPLAGVEVVEGPNYGRSVSRFKGVTVTFPGGEVSVRNYAQASVVASRLGGEIICTGNGPGAAPGSPGYYPPFPPGVPLVYEGRMRRRRQCD